MSPKGYYVLCNPGKCTGTDLEVTLLLCVVLCSMSVVIFISRRLPVSAPEWGDMFEGVNVLLRVLMLRKNC